MVSGYYYGIQYEIFLTKEIDFYDDLLPIWMEVRSRIEIVKDKQTGNYKLIVITYHDLSRQLRNNSLFESYIIENDKISNGCKVCDNEFLRKFKFVMVRQYEKFIRHKTSLPEPITKEEFEKLCIEKNSLDNKLEWGADILSLEKSLENERKYSEICKQLQIQRIIHDPEYFQEIKSLHTQLIEQVSFDEKQRECIQKIISHPKLNGVISWHGLTLVDGFW